MYMIVISKKTTQLNVVIIVHVALTRRTPFRSKVQMTLFLRLTSEPFLISSPHLFHDQN